MRKENNTLRYGTQYNISSFSIIMRRTRPIQCVYLICAFVAVGAWNTHGPPVDGLYRLHAV